MRVPAELIPFGSSLRHATVAASSRRSRPFPHVLQDQGSISVQRILTTSEPRGNTGPPEALPQRPPKSSSPLKDGNGAGTPDKPRCPWRGFSFGLAGPAARGQDARFRHKVSWG